jgi:predicted TIM-barrel fold metal-dependent hydrolase
MTVDCYTQIWESPSALGRCMPVVQSMKRKGATNLDASIARHLTAGEPVDCSFVLGFRSHYLGANVTNDLVASYAMTQPDRIVGFAGLDPTNPKEASIELRRSRNELGLQGVNVAPAAQDFHPCDSRAMLLYAEAAEFGMPVIFHTGPFLAPETKLEYAHPMLLDAIARDLPNLKIIVAHLGFPWVDETLTLLMKHPNVYAEISWIVRDQWQAYRSLLTAMRMGVIDKLLFGSGFPAASASLCIESLYGLNHLVQGTNLPAIPREQLRGIVERDVLGLLGIRDAQESPKAIPPNPAHEEEFETV